MHARLCIARGLFAFEKGEPEVAEAQYAECVEQNPTERLVVTQAVAFYGRLGQHDRANEILERAFEESGNGYFRMALARRMGALGQPEEEERLLREEARARPTAMTWFVVADRHARREEFPEAIEAFQQAMRRTARS